MPGLTLVPDLPLPSPAERVLAALNSPGDADLQEIVNLVQSICEVQAAAISLLSEGQFHLAITAGMEPLVCAASDSLCAHTMDAPYGVFVEDASTDARFKSSPYVDGTLMSIRFYASAPIYAPGGEIIGRLCILDAAPKQLSPLQAQTLTTLAANATGVLELRIRQHEEAAHLAARHAASDEVLRVAAQVSHDLRIPLTALTTSLEMLHESHPADIDPIRLRVFNSARRAAQRMNLLVEGILRLNDVDRNLSISEVDLDRVAHQAVADAGPLLQRARATVHIGSLPTLHADGDQMYSLLLNLVSNAVKFARPGVPPDITFASRHTPTGWRISVSDNGLGIPIDQRERMFSMFWRLDPSVEGHGIGLATVAHIVRAHGGTVGAEEAPGGGAEIWFEVPHRSR